jgi:hypothetical protein
MVVKVENRIAELLEIWHPIMGKYYHIVQVNKDGIRTYYTDGVKVHEAKINKDGFVERSPDLFEWVEDSRETRTATYEKEKLGTDKKAYFIPIGSQSSAFTPPKFPPEGTTIEVIRENHQTKGIRFRIEYNEDEMDTTD